MMVESESLHSSQHEHNQALPTPADEDTREEEEEPKNSFVTGLRRFLLDSIRSKAVFPAFFISVLLSFSIGLTVGIVPEVLTDRYARLYHGYDAGADNHANATYSETGEGGDYRGLQPLQHCWEYDTDSMPEACVLGADDAQTGSAYGMLVQNLLTLFFNAVVGSYSDEKGRRPLLLVSIFLNTLVPVSVVALEVVEWMDPVWYYAANALPGVVSYPSLIFAMLSDACPEEHRAGRFATNLAGFYGGFALAPTIGTYGSHIVVSWWSLALMTVGLVYSILFLPETLPESVATPTNSSDGTIALISHSLEQRQHSSMVTTRSVLAVSQGENEVEEHEGPSPEQESSIDRTPNSVAAASSSNIPRCLHETGTLLLRPLEEMAILTRSSVLKLLAIASFLSAVVYNTDNSLVLFYIEEYLNVRENDIAVMFFLMGLVGVILQGICLQPLVYVLGEQGLLAVTFVSGTIHNWLYGVAKSKTDVTVALSLSQLTKLNYALLSSLASQQVGLDEQGRVQGALMALNALAGAVGPVSMNWIYERTKQGNHKPFGPGTMFLVMAGLYMVGTVVVSMIPSSTGTDGSHNYGSRSSNSAGASNAINRNSGPMDETSGRGESCDSATWEGEDLEEPLLLQLGDTVTI
jgi:DHA1 family tetracycline resistance protein-like MFS transporter